MCEVYYTSPVPPLHFVCSGQGCVPPPVHPPATDESNVYSVGMIYKGLIKKPVLVFVTTSFPALVSKIAPLSMVSLLPISLYSKKEHCLIMRLSIVYSILISSNTTSHPSSMASSEILCISQKASALFQSEIFLLCIPDGNVLISTEL